MKKIFKQINIKNLKNGSYSVLLTVAVVAVVIIINLIVGEIPSKYTQIDVSDEKLYSITDQTEEFVKALENDIEIYFIVQSGNEDTTIEKMLTRYKDASKHIKVEKKDPVLYPNFTSQYTQDTLSENSMIVVSGDKSKVLEYSSLYETEVDYTTYSSQTTGFDGEGQLTSAISYVISDDTPVLYTLEGHGEQAVSSSFSEAVDKNNIDIQSLNLLTEESIPEDTAALMIAAPTNDISQEETELIIEYLENGGKALIFSDYSTEKFPNFMSILESYGVTTEEGVILEGDSKNYISQTPYYIVPNIRDTDITQDVLSNSRYVLMPIAQGIKKLDSYRDTLNIETLLSTSDSAYSKIDVENMSQYAKESGDISGPFDVGVAITETAGSEQTQIAYFSSYNIMEDSANQMVSGGNIEMVMSALSWMCKEEGSSISIPSKSLQLESLTLTAYDVSMWSIVTLVLIPGLFLVSGLVIWLRRRKL